MTILKKNISVIRNYWNLSADDFSTLFGPDFNKNNIYTYEKKTEPPVEFLLKLEAVTGFSIRQLCTVEINKFDIPDRPYRRSEGIEINSATLLLEEPKTQYGNQVVNLDNETIVVQRKLIAMLEARIKDLELQIENLKTN